MFRQKPGRALVWSNTMDCLHALFASLLDVLPAFKLRTTRCAPKHGILGFLRLARVPSLGAEDGEVYTERFQDPGRLL